MTITPAPYQPEKKSPPHSMARGAVDLSVLAALAAQGGGEGPGKVTNSCSGAAAVHEPVRRPLLERSASLPQGPERRSS